MRGVPALLLGSWMAVASVQAFAPIQPDSRLVRQCLSTSLSSTFPSTSIELSLRKPLGLILEEVEEGQAQGLYVQEVSDTGSAAQYAAQIGNAKLLTVQGRDVTQVDFDTAMDAIINAPETVEISFLVEDADAAVSTDDATPSLYRIGDPVNVVVQNGGDELVLSAKVGDNLRQVLLENGVEVYQGFQKLGNCGGGGQCGFCAFDFVDSKGWEPRSKYEDGKLGPRFPDARLSCLNNLQGPVTVRKTSR